MTSRRSEAYGLACGLAFVFLLAGLSARPIAANEPALPVAPTALAAQAETAAPAAAERPVALALAEIPPMPRPAPEARATPPAFPAPARFFTINEVLARGKAAATAKVRLAAVDPADAASDAAAPTPPIRGEEPFGLFVFRAPDGLLWTKWRKLEADIAAAAPALARCRAEPSACSAAEARFAAVIAAAARSEGRARIETVNRMVNDAIRYTSDAAQWGVPDRWSAPLAADGQGSFDTGRGDCEDYAIAKYVALRAAGTPAQELRLLLVRDNVVHLAHAVVAARIDARWLILDNRTSMLLEENEARFLTPLFALDEDGVKLFAAPYARGPDRGRGGDGVAGASLAGAAPAADGRESMLPLLM
jgi:predicted transglutaminase-like cysteine proteinase